MSDTSSFAEYNVKDELVLFGQGMFLKLMTSPWHVTYTSMLLEHPRDLYTGQSINKLENGPSSYRQKCVYFAWIFMKL